MSVRVMSQVWEHSKSKGSQLLVLLALADFADDDGYCWPSYDTLANKARISKRQIQRIIKELQEIGEIIVEQKTGRGHSNRYTIKVGKVDNLTTFTDSERVTPEVERVTPRVKKVDIAMSPEPSLTIKEPSVKDSFFDLHDEKRLLEIWGKLFPEKTQPNNGTHRAKIKTRMRNGDWAIQVVPALEKASRSHHLNTSGWFQFEYIVRNHQNIFGILEGRFDGFDRDHNTEPDTIKEWLEEYDDE